MPGNRLLSGSPGRGAMLRPSKGAIYTTPVKLPASVVRGTLGRSAAVPAWPNRREVAWLPLRSPPPCGVAVSKGLARFRAMPGVLMAAAMRASRSPPSLMRASKKLIACLSRCRVEPEQGGRARRRGGHTGVVAEARAFILAAGVGRAEVVDQARVSERCAERGGDLQHVSQAQGELADGWRDIADRLARAVGMAIAPLSIGAHAGGASVAGGACGAGSDDFSAEPG